MKKRTWWAAALLIVVALAVYFEPTHCVRGLLWGEAFFDGRPTSYWRVHVVRDLQQNPEAIVWIDTPPISGWWDRCMKWFGIEKRVHSSWSLLQGGENGSEQPVLMALSRDQNTNVSGFARDIRSIHRADVVFGEKTWRDLLGKHHLKN